MASFQQLLLGFLNHLIQNESWAQQRLRIYRGSILRLEAGPVLLALQVSDQGFFAEASGTDCPDVVISLPADAPLRFVINRNSVLASVKLSGSADVAEGLAFVLKNLRWDVEADVAEWIGDVPARRLVQLGSRTFEVLQNGAQRVAQNFAEYANEDSGLLPPEREVLGFSDAVNRLRDDVARLEKRISRMAG